MGMRIERLTTGGSGRLESHSTHIAPGRSSGAAQAAEQLHILACDSAHESVDEFPGAQVNDQAYRLHLQFLRAHGAPKGELTTLLSDAGEHGA